MKKAKLLIATLCMSSIMSMTAMAGQWKQDSIGWWYQNDNGSYPANQWLEIDGKQYYFDSNGYMLHDTTTPDGYKVGSDGAWIPEESAPLFNFSIGTCSIKYTGYRIITDYEGYPCLELYYDYTNNDAEAVGAWLSDLHITVFQNGVECETAFIWEDRDEAIDNFSKDVLPGTTINVASCYRLTDMSDVTIQIKELWNWENPQSQMVTLSIQ